MTGGVPNSAAIDGEMAAAEQAAAKEKIAQETDKELMGGVVGTATKNSLDSNLNYGSGLQAYGWGCINKVEEILEDYKTRVSRHEIEKVLRDIGVNDKFEYDKDFKNFCKNLKVSSSDDLVSKLEEQVGSLDDDSKKKIKAKYKEISQEVDSKYQKLRKEIAKDFYKRWEIDKLSSENLAIDAGAALAGGPLNFLGHMIGSCLKIRASEVMPEEAQKKFQEAIEEFNRENDDSDIKLEGEGKNAVALATAVNQPIGSGDNPPGLESVKPKLVADNLNAEFGQ
jgi:hypothetical protein